jgi:hypothetical protein
MILLNPELAEGLHQPPKLLDLFAKRSPWFDRACPNKRKRVMAILLQQFYRKQPNRLHGTGHI